MTKPVVIVLVVVAGIGALRAAQKSASGTGEISGVVIEEATGAPVPGAWLSLYGSVAASSQAQRSDVTGAFRFSNLPAGRFSVTAHAPGFLDGAIGKRRPWGDEVWLTLAAGERKAEQSVVLFKPASISGRVTDEGNRPVENFIVNAWPGPGNQNRAGTWERTGVTSSSGDYTIENLIPGDYIVAAHIRHDTYRQTAPASNPCVAPPPGYVPPAPASLPPVGSLVVMLSRGVPKAGPIRADGAAMTYGSVYFPAAATPAGASPVILHSGDRLTSIDFRLTPVAAATVSGRLMSPKGVPLGSDVRLVLPGNPHPDPDTPYVEAQSPTESDGTFTLLSVPTGAYILKPTRAISEGSCDVAPGHDSDSHLTTLPIEVPLGGVRDLEIQLVSSVEIIGKVELRGTAQPPDQIGVSVLPTEPRLAMADVRDRQIRINAAAGFQYEVQAGEVAMTPRWWLDRVTVSGRDVTGLPFRVTGPSTDSLVVTLTDHPSKVSGVVTGSNGRPADATVLLFPVDPRLWPNAGRGRLRFPVYRALDGTFEFIAVPAGDYYVAAVDEATMDAWPSATFLTSVAVSASRISVAAGAVQSVALKPANPGRKPTSR
jgi:hypothetical protein